jgi:hypothetical protein
MMEVMQKHRVKARSLNSDVASTIRAIKAGNEPAGNGWGTAPPTRS